METWYLRILEILERMMLDYNGSVSTYAMLNDLRKEIVAAEEKEKGDDQGQVCEVSKCTGRQRD